MNDKNLLALSPEQLYTRCDPAGFDFSTTAQLEPIAEAVGQEAALEAVRFGVGIRREGYNLFVLGPSGLGKHTLVRAFLESRAAKEPVPGDWCYVNDFDHPHKPRALSLPAGRATGFQRDMEQLVEELKSAIPACFESDEYRTRLEDIDVAFKERQEKAFKELGSEAEKQGVALLQTPGGFAFGPIKDGEVITPDDYEKLPDKEKGRIEAVVASFQERLQKIIHQIPQWRRERRRKIKELNQEISQVTVGQLLDSLREQYVGEQPVLAYLDAVKKDVIEHLDEFRRAEEPNPNPLSGGGGEEFFKRYQVNALVDRKEAEGAPVVYEDHPMYGNLVGRVEHLSQWGALVTDFTLIKAGALHRANGGYLLLDAYRLLVQPFAWDSLKRVLRSREIRIESVGQMLGLVSTVSLEPEPIPLDVKVVLFGERQLYYLLCEYDPDFAELFKVAADFEDEIDRNAETHGLYARLVATLAQREGLLPFDRGAVARVIEHAARRADDAEKLSTHMRGLADLLREADFWGREAKGDAVTAADVQQAIDSRIRRADRLRKKINEEILRGTLMIDTDGERVGQVNGLVVIDLGNFAFGHPTRISATTRVGEGELIDIEREVELSGPIHSKGVLILSSFLAQRYAREHPLSLAASLTFEQSYSEVEGDSASVGELCALLSSLAGVPVKQSLAVTGSVNQYGEVQPIGGVNEKIEGFFDICRERGLTGGQGVLIPRANVKHLMLREDVVEAARQGKFHVYAVDTVDQAVELLTGTPMGELDASGRAPEGSISALVMHRLEEFSKARHAHGEKEEKHRRRKYGPPSR
ncbi:MAG: Lon protease family protein [Sulfuricellaceae bacterium]|jgi:lon-related putative ATP-dependent protease